MALAQADSDEDSMRLGTAGEAFKAREAEVRAVRGEALALVRDATGDRSYNDVNYVFPTFILTQMPVGLVGLLIAAIFAAAMSTISAEMASLSAATVIDFYRRFARRQADDRITCAYRGSRRVLGAVRERRGRLGGRTGVAHRGRQPLRFVLLRLNPRCVHPCGRLSPGHGERRVRRADCGHGLGRVGRQLHKRGLSLAQRDRCGGGGDGWPCGERGRGSSPQPREIK